MALNQRVRLDLATAEFIDQNIEKLDKEKKSAFQEFFGMLMKGYPLTDAQHNYLEGMYESVMDKVFGLGKCDVHVDLKTKARKNLRY